MKITVVGTGYVGLVSGTCFAETGNHVLCVDIDHQKVEKLKNGNITIYEPGLEKLFSRNLKEGRLTFTTDLGQGVAHSSLIFLALPTPSGEDGSADLRYVLDVANEIGKLMNGYKVIVNKNTVPVGISELVRSSVREFYDREFDVVSNPEFLREGVAVNDFMKPDRIVIGTDSERVKILMSELYAPFVRKGNPIFFMDERSAELIKYAANSFLATKISFMNEISQLCERMGANVDMIRKGIGSDERIGKRFVFSGIGYGGSCFPKDVKALIKSSEQLNYNFRILKAVEDVNQSQKKHLFNRIKLFFSNDLKQKIIGIWGLAFKPNTDDMREAPALEINDSLLNEDAKIRVLDPEAMENVRNIYKDIILYANNLYDVLAGADALVVATEWYEFRSPYMDQLEKRMKRKVIFDGRNLFDSGVMKKLGYYYERIGR